MSAVQCLYKISEQGRLNRMVGFSHWPHAYPEAEGTLPYINLEDTSLARDPEHLTHSRTRRGHLLTVYIHG